MVALSGSARHTQVWVREEILVCSHIIDRSRIPHSVLQKNGNLAASFQMEFTELAVSKKTVTNTCLCRNTEII